MADGQTFGDVGPGTRAGLVADQMTNQDHPGSSQEQKPVWEEAVQLAGPPPEQQQEEASPPGLPLEQEPEEASPPGRAPSGADVGRGEPGQTPSGAGICHSPPLKGWIPDNPKPWWELGAREKGPGTAGD